MQVETKRQLFRLKLHISVRYKFAKKSEPGKYRVSKFFKGMGQDFSEGGAAIKVSKSLPVKTLVYLEMMFPFKEEPVLATAEVVRAETSKFKGKKVPLIILRYLIIDMKDHSSMTSYLISRGKSLGESNI